MSQQPRPDEVIVIDGGSKDSTLQIAASFGATVIAGDHALLEARVAGVRESVSAYIMMLDADQIVKSGTLERCLQAIRTCDALILGEDSLDPLTFLQRLFFLDRLSIHSNETLLFNPLSGIGLPRFFRRQVLVRALDNIPRVVQQSTISSDHAIIYYELSKITNRVGVVSGCLYHIEPETLQKLWAKNVRYGYNSRCTLNLIRTGAASPEYQWLLAKKSLGRLLHPPTSFRYWFGSLLLTSLKLPAYGYGFLKGKPQ
jgi:glycosyltransferase involved in cell wall biosynthesis